MKKGKIQTNEYNVNVLVEHENGDSKHYSHLDENVLCEKMSEEEIEQEFNKLLLTTENKIQFLKQVKGFAVSSCSGKDNEFQYGDLFKYKII